MYCRYCGKELPDDARFCSNCGTAQGGGTGARRQETSGAAETGAERPKAAVASPEKPKAAPSKTPIVVICVLAVLAVALVAVVVTLLSGTSRTDAAWADTAWETQPKSLREDAPVTVPTQAPAAAAPRDGWQRIDGKRYYYQNGAPLTGLQELDRELYYFYDDGSLAVSTTIYFGDDSLQFGADGKVSSVTYATVPGGWAAEDYYFGNGGSASVLELDDTVKRCRSMTLYLEASGLYGAHVNGTWKLYIRSHGVWEYVKDLNFREPDGSFTISFSTLKDFDAVTVYPTIQGNATYNVYFDIFDVCCRP